MTGLAMLEPRGVRMSGLDTASERESHFSASPRGYGSGQLVSDSIQSEQFGPCASTIVLASGGLAAELPRWFMRKRSTLASGFPGENSCALGKCTGSPGWGTPPPGPPSRRR
jgi:hypothetical protein